MNTMHSSLIERYSARNTSGQIYRMLCVLVVLSLFFRAEVICAQSENTVKTAGNLEKLYMLVDSSAGRILSVMHNNSNTPEEASLLNISRGDYLIFTNRLVKGLTDKGVALKIQPAENSTDSSRVRILYAIDHAGVKYTDTFRDGWFGALKVKRLSELGGSITVTDNARVRYSDKFFYSIADTVLYENLAGLESRPYGFTQSAYPPEPVFENLIEPVIAVGAAAAAVYLFFAIRSK
ncbi:MAG: hypothetical protein ACM3SM_01790 [Bacteroidota bacterium]